MAEETEAQEDPLLQRVARIKKEFVAHRERLKERSKELGELLTKGELTADKLPELLLELYLELQDTSLSLQEELTSVIYDDMSAIGDDEDLDDDEDVEEDEEGDERGDDRSPLLDDPSQLLPEDAKQLRRTALDYSGMLDAMMKEPGFQSFTPAQRQEIADKLSDAQASIDLIDQLELRDDDAVPAN